MSAAPADLQARPYVVGLTGGIGSGKTTVARLFADLGAALVDTDEVAHTLTAAGGRATAAISAAFGPQMLSPDGAMNRPAMRALVFSNPGKKTRLEAILHPMIRQASREALNNVNAPYVLLIVPLLVETRHYISWCQRVLVVDCDEETQLQRVMLRSKLSREQALQIMASQTTRAIRLAAADDVIDNNAEAEALPAQVSILHQRYIAAAQGLKQNRW